MLATRAEVALVYASGIITGILFGTLPALSTVITGPATFDLSPTEYGLLFVPQSLAAIVGSVGDGIVTRWVEHRLMLLVALTIGAGSLALIAACQMLPPDAPITYAALLLASTALGLAFGLATPLLMTLAGGFFPGRRDRAVLMLNATLAFGAAVAPLIVALGVSLGAWYAMPVIVAVVLVIDVLVGRGLPLKLPAVGRVAAAPGGRATSGGRSVPGREGGVGLPRRFWLYLAFIFLYGCVQTINSAWAGLFMTEDIGATATQGALAITVFWVMVGIGRVTFGALDRILPDAVTYRIGGFIAAAALVLVSLVPDGDVIVALVAFGLTGLGVSVFLPLTVSFAQREMPAIRTLVSGSIFASLMVGYLVTAFGVGPAVEHLGIDPSVLYLAAAVLALGMAGLSFVVVRGLEAASPQGERAPA